MRTLILTRTDIETLLEMKDAISSVENAFKYKSNSDNSVKAWLFFNEFGGDLACWSTHIKELGASGVKAIGYNTNNPEKGISTITAVIILHDPKTSFPISIMDGTSITAIRTGAAAAVAAKYLARKDSKVVSIIGAGVQGRTQLIGLKEIFNLEKVKIYDISSKASKKYSVDMSERLDLNIEPCKNAKEAVINSDIIATATPSRTPIVLNEWITQGVHINAIGADEPGKGELDPQILKRSKIVVDDINETVKRGEINMAISNGIIQVEDIYADLEEIVTRKKIGRTSNEEITIFDGAGVAIEDISVAWKVYNEAVKRGIGKYIDLI